MEIVTWSRSICNDAYTDTIRGHSPIPPQVIMIVVGENKTKKL